VNEIKEFLYYGLLTVTTIGLLVVLGNWLGLLGLILAFMLPMFAEIVRSVMKATKMKSPGAGLDK